jgi:hypothetical protein
MSTKVLMLALRYALLLSQAIVAVSHLHNLETIVVCVRDSVTHSVANYQVRRLLDVHLHA